MNPLPPNADELVSAYLDGEAAPDEIALVESNPELLEQVESLRSLTGPLAQSFEPPPAKEAHLSAALDLFDELSAAEDDAPLTAATQPHLAAVPKPQQQQTADSAPAPASSGGTVTSFEEARERRRRRVSPTVIAAAIAAVALLLFAVFSAGGRNDDVATSSLDTAVAANDASADSADARDDAGEAAMEEEAMDEEEAMADEEVEEAEGVGGMSDAAEAPQAAPADAEDSMAESAMDEEEAMDDEEAMDEEEAMADEEVETDADDEDSDGGDNGGDDAGPDNLAGAELYRVFGDVTEPPVLQEQLAALDIADLMLSQNAGFEGLFPRCRSELDVLPDDENSLIGEGLVDEMPVEVHLVETSSERRIYVIAADECRVVFDFALGA